MQRQRWRTCAAAEVEDKDGWQDTGRSGGGRGVTVVWQQRRNSFAVKAMEDGGRRRAARVFVFSFLGKVESYLESYLDES
jgi:hypothetical protein